MKHRATALVSALFALIAIVTTPALAAEKKVALVVGNAAYMHTADLRNSRNDAEDVAAMLGKLGFEVVLGLDLTRPAFRELLNEFVKTLQGANRAVFYYSGHALQVEGRNYLVPTDARLNGELALDFELVGLNLVQRALERQVASNVIFLDACRDNPLARNLARNMGSRSARIGRGLAPAESGIGTLISFSTQPGNVAADGTGRNSPFTTALLKFGTEKGADVSTILIKVRRAVMAATENKQVPWEHSALRHRFFLNDTALSTAQLEEQPSPATQEGESEFWTLVQASEDPAFYREYLTMFPNGPNAEKARLRLAALTGLAREEAAPSGATVPLTRSREELVTRAQKLLQRAGCYAGKVDGIWGRQSRYALRKALGPRIASSKLDPVIILRLEILVPGQCAPERAAKPDEPRSSPTTPPKESAPSRRKTRRKATQTRKTRPKRERTRKRTATRSRPSEPKWSRPKRNEVSAECRSWQRCAGASHPYRVRIDCPGRPRGCTAWNQ